MAISAALVRVTRSGEGDYLDVAMADLLATWTGPLPEVRRADGQPMGGGAAGYGTFRTADDQWIALGVLAEQPLWRALATTLGLAELAELSFAERSDRMTELNTQLAAVIGRADRASLVERLTRAGAPVSPVREAGELVADPQLLARGVVRRTADGATEMTHPVHYQEHPAGRSDAVPPLRHGVAALPAWP
jgi:crotonobetainyl-CoA:carnitine CoA-transferase CaiB-like acyl-CoA transferase